MSRRLRVLLAGALVAAMMTASVAPALAQEPPGAQGTPPPATPEGCHGYYTVLYKQLTGDPSQAPGIVPQTQSPKGMGETLQAFLGAACGVGSRDQGAA